MADPDTVAEDAAGVLMDLSQDPSEDGPGGAVSPPAWWLFASIVARVGAGRLDRALATRTDPRGGALLERRVAQLTSWRARRVAADVLESRLVEAGKPRSAVRRLIEPALPFRLLGLLPGVDLRIVADRTQMTKEEDG